MRRNTKRDRTIAACLFLLATILLVASLFVGWWIIQGIGEGVTDSMSFGFPATSGGNGVSYTCSGGEICPSSDSYSDLGLNNTGNLYSTTQVLVIGAVIFGLLGTLIAFGTWSRRSWITPSILLIFLALVLALIAPALLAISQPGAIQQDGGAKFAGTNGTNPSNSFWGSSSSGTGNFTVTYTWGATTGWLLSLVAFTMYLVGWFVLGRTRYHILDIPPIGDPTSLQTLRAPSESESQPSTSPDPEWGLTSRSFYASRAKLVRSAFGRRAKFFKERSSCTG